MSATGAAELSIRARSAFEFAVSIDRLRPHSRSVVNYPPGTAFQGGDGSGSVAVILSGWACEARVLADGRRQIFYFLLPGDVVELAAVADHDDESRQILALTRLETVDARAIGGEAADPEVAAALAEGPRLRDARLLDQMVRIGRLSARERVLHLFLELCERLQAVVLAREGAFRAPVTQEVFADALGLSVTHLNRTLQELRREGLVGLGYGTVRLLQTPRLAALACYGRSAISAPRASA